MTWTVHAFYKFASLPDFQNLRLPMLQCCRDAGLVGSILLAHEGINGTVAGTEDGLAALWTFLNSEPRLQNIKPKVSYCDHQPFKRMKVRLKKEIVTIGVTDIDPVHDVGTYVEPERWNDLISDPGILLIDTRNEYEIAEGTFEGAMNPRTASFREFPRFAKEQLDPARDLKIATFCTGGIRCEKATAYLVKRGFKNVFHLRGGILNYLEHVPPEKSKWHGHCFVFDEREKLDHALAADNARPKNE
jgi:UPF0176 protein